MSTVSRSFNSTGRKAIPATDIDITILPVEIDKPLFASIKLKNEKWDFPGKTKIILEAYQKNNGMRFDFGTIESPSLISPIILELLDPSSSVLFRLKLVEVENGTGKILASTKALRPGETGENAGRRSFFPVVTRDIRNELWRVEILNEGPTLILNARVPDFKRKILENPLISGILLPAAFKEVLTHIIKNNEIDLDEENTWWESWIEYCITELNSEHPSEIKSEDEIDDGSEDGSTDWIENQVAMFCEKNNFVTNVRDFLKEVD